MNPTLILGMLGMLIAVGLMLFVGLLSGKPLKGSCGGPFSSSCACTPAKRAHCIHSEKIDKTQEPIEGSGLEAMVRLGKPPKDGS